MSAGGDLDRRSARDGLWTVPCWSDARWMLACFLGGYVVLGQALSSYQRAPLEVAAALAACAALDVVYGWVTERRLCVPLSGVLAGLGVAVLFASPGNAWLLLVSGWLAVTSAYVVTWRGRALFPPTSFALVLMLLASRGEVAVAPAYQWGASFEVVAVVMSLGLVVMAKAKKLSLVVSFFAVLALGALLREELTQVPASVTLWAQVSSGAFVLFSFFMITDAETSPSEWHRQLRYGVVLGVVDIALQLVFATSSLYYALFVVCLVRGLYLVYLDARARFAAAPAG